MLRKIILLALTSSLAVKLYRNAVAARVAGQAPVEKEALHTWEDEGGALPPQHH